MIELEELEPHLNKIPKSEWARLFELLPEMEGTKRFGEWIGMEEQKDGSMSMPYMNLSEVVSKFIEVAYALDIVPAFDWTDWSEGKEILRHSDQHFESLDAVTLCRLLTVIIRADRFVEGTIVGRFHDGTIPKIVSALRLKYY